MSATATITNEEITAASSIAASALEAGDRSYAQGEYLTVRFVYDGETYDAPVVVVFEAADGDTFERTFAPLDLVLVLA